MNPVTALLEDIKSDRKKRGALGLGENLASRLVEESKKINLAHRSWLTASPSNDDHIAYAKQLGVLVSKHRDNGRVHAPVCLRLVEGEIWVGSTHQRLSRYDLNGSFLGYWVGPYGDPRYKRYDSLRSFAVDEENDRIYIAMSIRHRVSAFRLSTGQYLWTFGDGHGGDLKDDRVNNPVDVEVLSNGNVLVCSYNGRGEQDAVIATGNGHLTELEAETGNVVVCRIMHQPNTSGNAWENACKTPVFARVLSDGLLYVSMLDDHVGVWNPETWELVKSYSKPQGVDIASIRPRGITLNPAGDELIVVANAPKKLVALGIEDNDYKWHVGQQGWDDKANAANRIGEFQDIYDILSLGDNRYAVADFGNNRVMIVSNQRYIDVPYDIRLPEGYEIVDTIDGFIAETNTLRVPVEDIESVGEIILNIQHRA